jgi:hypothetical protein
VLARDNHHDCGVETNQSLIIESRDHGSTVASVVRLRASVTGLLVTHTAAHPNREFLVLDRLHPGPCSVNGAPVSAPLSDPTLLPAFMVYSDDGGHTWAAPRIPLIEDDTVPQAIAANPADQRQMVYFQWRDINHPGPAKVWYSADGFDTWARLDYGRDFAVSGYYVMSSLGPGAIAEIPADLRLQADVDGTFYLAVADMCGSNNQAGCSLPADATDDHPFSSAYRQKLWELRPPAQIRGRADFYPSPVAPPVVAAVQAVASGGSGDAGRSRRPFRGPTPL